ncbi:unnamed protein product [Heligmosomoides polygyrus]|uniref:RBR-type E3 ubiquitin transferase n=1 Tax=Heligmosomoides polygyrus TaxID=6339 RepID=A0A3P8ATB2_HELPZ|nr:unnamed protein product [Heligmosomoides polygyrus]
MPGDFPHEQEEEIEALISSLGEELVHIDQSRDLLEGCISVELEVKNHMVTVFVNTEEGLKQFRTKHLSPMDLHFRLPRHYPTTAADLRVECVWVTKELNDRILDLLDGVTRENAGFPQLYLCYDSLKDFLNELDLDEVCLDGNPFSVKEAISGSQLLEAARKTCDNYDLEVFLRGYHDCGVCLEHKSGSECARFTPCDHIYCKDCIRTYFQLRLTEQQVAPLSCLADACQSYPSDSLLKEVIGEEQFERYEQIILSNALSRMDDVVLCPRARCQKTASVSGSNASLATCLTCGFSFCTKCRRAYHGVNPCRPTVIAVSRMIENEDGTLTFKKITVEEYMAASEDQRKEMAWWYGGMERLEVLLCS